MKIVVIGGSGLIGSKLVPKLREHERLLESDYFRAKIAQENLIKGSSIPDSILRIRQGYRRFFHRRRPTMSPVQ